MRSWDSFGKNKTRTLWFSVLFSPTEFLIVEPEIFYEASAVKRHVGRRDVFYI